MGFDCSWISQMAVVWLLLTSCSFLHRYIAYAQLSLDPDAGGGQFQLLVENAGVSAMHMALTHENTVILFDKTDVGETKLALSSGRCRIDLQDTALQTDCWAHAAEYNVETSQIRALTLQTDPWCSSGAFLADGTLMQTGGWNDGSRTVRYFAPCTDIPDPGAMTIPVFNRFGACDWIEAPNTLQGERWYATNQILPDNSVIVIGGRRATTYEFVPARSADSSADGVYSLPFLEATSEAGAENNLYPFVYLTSQDDVLFIFANRDSILLNYKTNEVLKQFNQIPGNGSRNYPSSGTSAMLPLRASEGFQRIEVIVCGGAPSEAFQETQRGTFPTALDSCGRLVITDDNPEWSMEIMPSPRVMADMVILPSGDLLLINGAKSGTAGWGRARDPILSPFLYKLQSGAIDNSRWTVLAESSIPRMYHSTAVLLRDGRVLVGGSNTNVYYNYTGVLFPTELRLEAFSPPYLDQSLDGLRPILADISTLDVAGYNSDFQVAFELPNSASADEGALEVRLYAPAFCTHSFSMNQRQLVLEATFELQQWGASGYTATVKSPPGPAAAPAGYYLLFVLLSGVPSVGQWLRLSGT